MSHNDKPDIKLPQIPAANLPLTGDELVLMDQAGNTATAPASEITAGVAADVVALGAVVVDKASTQTITGAKTFERPAAAGVDQADGPVFTFGGNRRAAVAQQGTDDQSPGAGIVEVVDGPGVTVGPGSRAQLTWYQYGATLRTTGPKAETLELWLGDEGTINGPNLSVRHNGGNEGALIQARDAGDFAGVMLNFKTTLRPRVMVEVTPNLPDDTVLAIENGNVGGKISLATDSGAGATDRLTVLNDGKVQVGPAAPNQLVGVSGPGAGVALQDTGEGGTSWELLSGNLGPGIFSIFDRATGHRVRIGPDGRVTIGTGPANQLLGIAGPAAGVALQDTGDSGRSWELLSGADGPGTFSVYDRSAAAHRLRIDVDGKVTIGGDGAANQLLAVSGPAPGVAIQDDREGARSWELLNGNLGLGVFSIFDRSAGHRLRIGTDGKVTIGGTDPANQLLGISGPAAGVALQDTGEGGRSWELLSGSFGAGIFSIFDRAAGHRLRIDTNGTVIVSAGRLDASAGGIQTSHVAGATPVDGFSGEIKVGNGKIWVNDGGTWKSVAVA